MKILILIFSLMFSASVFAQVALIPTKQVGPATYPPTARAVRATGEVTIDITIDSEGSVRTAKAVSGHPLLRAVSEQAVRFWKYEKVANESPIRTETVYLDYSPETEARMIPESEKSSEIVTETEFSSPNYGKVRLIYSIPRLLRLPRKEEAIESKRCSLHNDELSVEIRSYRCLSENEDRFEAPARYLDVYSELFPFAASPDRDDCSSDGIDLREVEYCANCRIARNNWLQIHTK